MITTVLKVLLCNLIGISSCFARSIVPQLSLEDPDFPRPDIPYTFRQGKYTDLDGVSDVIVSAFDTGAEWRYAYQFKDKYPVYHRECFRQAVYSQWNKLKDTHSTFLNVIEVPLPDTTAFDAQRGVNEAQSSRIAAIAIWKIQTGAGSSPDDGQERLIQPPVSSLFPFGFDEDMSLSSDTIIAWPNCSQHLDVNNTRSTNLMNQAGAVQHKIETGYPDGQVYLALLATHPDYDGHNFGAMHCRWGMELAKERGLKEPVTLMATPAGYPLYKSLGFESVKNFTLKFLDGMGGSWTEIMQWKYDADDKQDWPEL